MSHGAPRYSANRSDSVRSIRISRVGRRPHWQRGQGAVGDHHQGLGRAPAGFHGLEQGPIECQGLGEIEVRNVAERAHLRRQRRADQGHPFGKVVGAVQYVREHGRPRFWNRPYERALRARVDRDKGLVCGERALHLGDRRGRREGLATVLGVLGGDLGGESAAGRFEEFDLRAEPRHHRLVADPGRLAQGPVPRG